MKRVFETAEREAVIRNSIFYQMPLWQLPTVARQGLEFLF